MNRCDVLIIGAGPTGLVLALWLSKLGIKVRIIDKTAGPGTTSRALAVQARTLELYRQLDLTEAILEQGHQVPAANLWVKGEAAARLPFSAIGSDLTPYPFLHIYPQDQHEQLLIERLLGFGVAVERQTELLDFSQDAEGVTARLRHADGVEQVCAADYLAGCDGARSTVRKALGIGFPGGTYEQLFYVADVDGAGPTFNGELHVDLDEADFLAVFPLAGSGRTRLIGTVRDARAEHPEHLSFEDVSRRAMEHLKVEITRVNWFSTYRVHHRVAEQFSRGRALLLGDAAHVHSPAGGQGMNTGIGDAINLAWKLAAVLQGSATQTLLDTYEIERSAFARRLVSTTDQVFNFITADGRLATLVRTRVAPLLIPRVAAFKAARELLFRTVSQITLNYRDMPLSVGCAGQVHGGERMPWVSDGGHDNYAGLARMCWQVQVYGAASGSLVAWCAERGMPLEVFEWRDTHASSGLQLDGVYLLRPDSYVALAQVGAGPQVLEDYFSARGMHGY
ncbi:FAD-dependent oxidoreductase [Pseudomonas rubra]|uniref:FAD-dependent oxidoreductase n=1 Tax=Pseudomonas rubra TaxID=2942627 RepID=A0ABT5PEB3_9PSED|nr:FAD-dependent oxidoreductase [Pseudomonas rubra]MDD1016521.1 FAD-dependent oxidoreductase [Pseudomonas rubra]MDD1038523.1 FAD-dependent oxidoreductase [Pseudomonas rubra]MDD1156076.1 FAD-dependent oxidoreductase [Pseudomonas rubra]